jgi:glycerol-3-phosphate acyltransferase PlsY
VKAALAVTAAYVLGAVPTGYLVARAFGMRDIRSHGSGNIGATNVLRTLGRLPAVLTLLGDVAKGFAAVAVAEVLGAGDPLVRAVATGAAVTGNCWSIFLGFRGGKGVATGLGALLALVPLAILPAAVVWLALTATLRFVSLASMAAAVCVPIGVLLLGYPRPFAAAALAVGALIVLRHRDNIARLMSGTERRLGERAASP